MTSSNSGGWMWFTLLVLTAIYEGWAAFGNHQTMSEWIWMYTSNHQWFRLVFVALTVQLIYHLFFNGRT